jgi:hypothetical protein
MLKINNKFELNQEVYVKYEEDQPLVLIVSILITPNGLIYYCSDGGEYYDIELSADKDLTKL